MTSLPTVLSSSYHILMKIIIIIAYYYYIISSQPWLSVKSFQPSKRCLTEFVKTLFLIILSSDFRLVYFFLGKSRLRNFVHINPNISPSYPTSLQSIKKTQQAISPVQWEWWRAWWWLSANPDWRPMFPPSALNSRVFHSSGTGSL